MENWEDVKKELLKDPKVKAEYDRLEPEYKLISKIIEARIKNKMTQAELAKKVGTKQSAIARFEAGNSNPTLDFMDRLATALGAKLIIEIK